MRRILFAVGALSAALAAGPAAAQVGDGVHLVPRLGLYAPTVSLYRAGPTQELGTTVRPGPSLGAAVELQPAAPWLAVRAVLDYALASSRVDGYDARILCFAIDGPCAPAQGRSVGARILTATADVLLRPFPALAVGSPYLLLGGGFKRYRFRGDNAYLIPAPADATDAAVRLGAGLDARLGAASYSIELGDVVSLYALAGAWNAQSRVQHDLAVTVGVRLGLGR